PPQCIIIRTDISITPYTFTTSPQSFDSSTPSLPAIMAYWIHNAFVAQLTTQLTRCHEENQRYRAALIDEKDKVQKQQELLQSKQQEVVKLAASLADRIKNSIPKAEHDEIVSKHQQALESREKACWAAIRSAQDRADAATATEKQLRISLSELKSHADTRIRGAGIKMLGQEKREKELRNELLESRDSLQKCQEVCADLREKLETAENQISELQKICDASKEELEEKRKLAEMALQGLKGVNEIFHSQELKIAAGVKNAQSLQQSLFEWKSKHALVGLQLDSAEKDKKFIESELKMCREMLKEERDTHETAVSVWQQKEKDYEGIRVRLIAERNELEGKYSTQSRLVEDLQMRLADAQEGNAARNLELGQRVAEVEKDTAELQDKVKFFKDKLAESKDDHAALKNKVGLFQYKLAEAEKDTVALQDEVKFYKDKLAEAKDDNAALQDQVKFHKDKLAEAKDDDAALKKKVGLLEYKLAVEEEDKEGLEDFIKELVNRNEALTRELEGFEHVGEDEHEDECADDYENSNGQAGQYEWENEQDDTYEYSDEQWVDHEAPTVEDIDWEVPDQWESHDAKEVVAEDASSEDGEDYEVEFEDVYPVPKDEGWPVTGDESAAHASNHDDW
ncbi:hypothetical protein V8F20_012644, partial [Naviculisporaceae sp. PSN 640]